MSIETILKQCSSSFKSLVTNSSNLVLIPFVGLTIACSPLVNQQINSNFPTSACRPQIEEVTDCVNYDTRNNSQYCHSNIIVNNCGDDNLHLKFETEAEGFTLKSKMVGPKQTIFLVGGSISNCQPGYNEFKITYDLENGEGKVISSWPRENSPEKIILYKK
jgi:hypothetical protein